MSSVPTNDTSDQASARLTLAEMRASLSSPGEPSNEASAGGSDKRNWTGSDNLHHFSDVLVNALIAARAARGNRQQLRRPTIPRSTSDASIYSRMRSHLRKLTWRALNDQAKAGHDAPPVEVLADALAAYVSQECPRTMLDVAPGDPRPSSRQAHARLTPGALERLTLGAARYVLDRWTPDYIQEQQRRGARGGSTSKRGSKWTVADLEFLAANPGTVAAQADALSTSAATVKRMRAALRSVSRS